MKYVKIYKLQKDGSQSEVVTCGLIGDQIVCNGEASIVTNLEQEGIWDYRADNSNMRRRLFPKDGLQFLENLADAFNSGYLMATDIQES